MMRILTSLIPLPGVFAIYWLGGGNFERGLVLATTAVLALWVCLAVFIVTSWGHAKGGKA